MGNKNFEIVFNENQIINNVKLVADKINSYVYDNYDIGEEEFVFVGVLKGAFMFLSDLVKYIEFPIMIDFIQTSTYGLSQTPNEFVVLIKDITTNIKNKIVFVVEDIIDTGKTINFIKNHLNTKDPKKIYIVSLIEIIKENQNKISNFTVFEVNEKDKKFYAGYGLDDKELNRNVPYIYVC